MTTVWYLILFQKKTIRIHLPVALFWVSLSLILLPGFDLAQVFYFSYPVPYALLLFDVIAGFLFLVWMRKKDPRQILFFLVVLGIVHRALSILSFPILIQIRWTAQTQKVQLSLLLLWLSNPAFLFRHELYLDFFCLLLAMLCIKRLTRSIFISSLLIAGLSLTIQWGLVLVPYLCVLLTPPGHWKSLILRTLGTLSFIILGLMIFIKLWGIDFLQATGMHWEKLHGDLCFGWVHLFKEFESGVFILKFIQLGWMVFLGLGLFWAWLNKKQVNVLIFIGMVFLVFCSWNNFIESYFYTYPLLLIAIGYAIRDRDPITMSLSQLFGRTMISHHFKR